MAIKFSCPNPACGRPLTVKDEYAGQTGCCPACSVLFTVAPAGNPASLEPKAAPAVPRPRSVPAPDIVEDYEVIEEAEEIRPTAARRERSRTEPPSRPGRRGPRRERRRDVEELDEDDLRDPVETRGSRRSWSRVRLGLTFNYFAVCALLLAMAFALGGTLLTFFLVKAFGPSSGEVPSPAFLNAVALISLTCLAGTGLAALGAVVLGFIGLSLGCSAPSRHGAQALAISTLGLTATALLIGLGSLAFSASPLGIGLRYVAHVMTVASSFCFLFFMRALYRNLKMADLALGVRNLIIGQAVYIGLTIVVSVIGILQSAGMFHTSFVSSGGPAPLTMLSVFASSGFLMLSLALVLAVGGLVLFAWFMNTLVTQIQTIERKRLGGESAWGEVPMWVVLFSIDLVLWVIFIIVVFVLAATATASLQQRLDAGPNGFGRPPSLIRPRPGPNRWP